MSLEFKSAQVTGMGAITPIGIGIESFSSSLKAGRSNFSTKEFNHLEKVFTFPIGEVEDFDFKALISTLGLSEDIVQKARKLRHVSKSALFGIFCTLEAWVNAGLCGTDVDLTRVAIISSGSNTQQASLINYQNDYAHKLEFLNPNYGLNFFDTDIIGILTELLGITGEGFAIGGASASGNMAIIQGQRLLSSTQYDLVVVLAPLMDLSVFEFQGLTMLGAMARMGEDIRPEDICRPFDLNANGFVYGQAAGCLILESETHAARRGKVPYGAIAGYGISMDANRNPNPSADGEQLAMQRAIKMAQISAKEVSYINTHGTSSSLGDTTEVKAILSLGLNNVKVNSTKSLIGHGLSAAGLIEAIACLLQMKDGFLHKSANLFNPITDQLDLVKEKTDISNMDFVLNNSFGFGGINTSLVIKKIL